MGIYDITIIWGRKMFPYSLLRTCKPMPDAGGAIGSQYVWATYGVGKKNCTCDAS